MQNAPILNFVSLSLILAGVLLNGAAQLLLKAGTSRIGHFEFSISNLIPIGWQVATQPHIVIGLMCYAVSVVVWIMALSRVPVSIAFPMLSIAYFVTAFGGWFFFDEPLTTQKLLGIGVICVGVFIVARSA
jgi:multidrug transporter EmrE-like cation transporter